MGEKRNSRKSKKAPVTKGGRVKKQTEKTVAKRSRTTSHLIEVNPGGYSEEWCVFNICSKGEATVELPSGDHSVMVAGVSFSISVSAKGVVTGPPGTVEGGIKKLKFLTVPVEIECGCYDYVEGFFGVFRGPKIKLGAEAKIELVRGLRYRFSVARGARFDFTVTSEGKVTADGTQAAKASNAGGQAKLALNLVELTIDYKGYDWVHQKFGIYYGPQIPVGKNSVKVVKGLNYNFVVAYGAIFPIAIDRNGEISTTSTAAKASNSSGTASLKLNLTSLEIDVDGYQWREGTFGVHYGPKCKKNKSEPPGKIKVVKDVNYYIATAHGSIFPISIDRKGKVSADKTRSADAVSGNELKLNTVDLTIDDQGYQWVQGKFGVYYGPQLKKGENTIKVIKDASYFFAVAYGAIFPFAVDANGGVSTSSESATVSQGNELKLQLVSMVVGKVGTSFEINTHYGPDLVGSGELLLVRGITYNAEINGESGSLTLTG